MTDGDYVFFVNDVITYRKNGKDGSLPEHYMLRVKIIIYGEYATEESSIYLRLLASHIKYIEAFACNIGITNTDGSINMNQIKSRSIGCFGRAYFKKSEHDFEKDKHEMFAVRFIDMEACT